MDPAFIRGYKSAAIERPIVFGLRLKPLTLGHLFLLEALDCPVISGRGHDPTFADLAAAVFACANTHADAEKYFRKWWFPLFVWLWSKCAKPYWLGRDVEVFRNYLSLELGSPGLRPREGGGRVCQAPGPWLKLMFAMHVLNATREQAMGMEIVWLNALYCTFAEWSGCGEIVPVGDREALIAYAREQDAKSKEEAG